MNNRPRRGIALIWVALFLLVFVGFLGLAMDTGWMMLVNHQLQNAADASSLAGAAKVRSDQDQARLAAQQLAYANVGGTQGGGLIPLDVDLNDTNAADGDIVIGRFNRNTGVFTPTTTSPNAVRVNARRTTTSNDGSQPLLFGPIYGTDKAQVSRTATAILAGGLGAGLLVIDPRGTGPGNDALELAGGPELTVINGTIQVNSASNRAVRVQGNYLITGEELNIVGSMQNPPTTITVNTGMPVIPDPLAWMDEPNSSGMTELDANAGAPTSLSPGFYPNGIDVGNRNLTCAPGIYILGRTTTPANTAIFRMTSDTGVLTANGCTFFIQGGQLQWNNGRVNVSPPALDEGHYYEHVTIFQARNNAALASITGNQNYNITGTLYFPGRADGSNGPVFDLNGTFGGSGGGIGEGVQVIAYRVRLGGTANLYLLFDGWWPWPLPSRVFLVE